MSEQKVKVTDTSGNPLAGVMVELGGTLYRKSYGPIGCTPTYIGETDEKGKVKDWRRKP